MPLPTPAKTYEYVTGGAASTVNIATVSSGVAATDNAKAIWNFKNAWINFATHPLTVWGSSNGTGSFSTSGTDYWTSYTNLVWAASGTNHSWIVLKDFGTGAQILLDLNTSSSWFMRIEVSPGANYTGGSATTAPTASDAVPLLSTAAGSSAATLSSSAANTVVHTWHSTDATVLHLQVWSANTLLLWFCLANPANAISTWTTCLAWAISTGFQGGIGGSGSGPFLYGNAYVFGRWGSTPANNAMTFTGECVNGTLIASQMGSFADDDTGEWCLPGIGLYSGSASHRGRKGQLVDIWFGPTGDSNGDTFPSGASKTFVQVAGVVLPWNGTTYLTA